MMAGYETTATTLGWLVYDLVLNPDVQEKLLESIDAEIGQVGILSCLNTTCSHVFLYLRMRIEVKSKRKITYSNTVPNFLLIHK